MPVLDDTFKGDDAALIRSIRALLEMDASGSLAPHGVGGHARTLLASAAVRLDAARQEGAPAGDAALAIGAHSNN